MNRERRKRTRDDLLRSIEENSQIIKSSFEEIKDTAVEQLNIRRQITNNPWPWLIGGLLFGCWLGARSSNHRHRNNP